MLLELDAEPFVGRAVQAGAESLDDLSGEYLEVGQSAEIVRRQKIGDARNGSFSFRWRSPGCPCYNSRGSRRGISFNSRPIRSSTLTPSASALNVGTMRCRNTG